MVSGTVARHAGLGCLVVVLAAGACHLVMPLEGATSSAADSARDAAVDRGWDAAGETIDGGPCAWSLKESFEAPLDLERIWSTDGCSPGSGSIQVQGETLVLQPQPDVVNGCYVGYMLFDWNEPVSFEIGSWVQVQVVETLNPEVDVDMGLTLTDGTWELNTAFTKGKVVFRKWEPKKPEISIRETFAFTNEHMHWRIRRLGDGEDGRKTVVWETSSDGQSWTERVRDADARELNFEQVWFSLWAGSIVKITTNPGVARFDNFEAAAGDCR